MLSNLGRGVCRFGWGVCLVLALAMAGSAPPPPILEDSPGWDCRIHGNRICGGLPRTAHTEGN